MSRIAAYILPTDPDERRRLWREWIGTDQPAVERPDRERNRSARSATAQIAFRKPAAASPVEDTEDSVDWLPEAIDHPAPILAGLRAAVDEALFDGHLTMGDRQRLVRRSMRLGLSRFEASLLIAAVQHRAGTRRVVRSGTRSRRWSVGKLVATIILAEALVAAGVASVLL